MVTTTRPTETPYRIRTNIPTCPNTYGWLRGRCQHGNERWIKLSCKRRDCPVCGELRKRRIAFRLQYGLRILGNAAWFVGTWDYHVSKKDAINTQQHFIQWLRRDQGIPIEYAAVWEQTRSGRLHINLLMSPWTYIKQAQLSTKWATFGGGFVVWIERADSRITPELTKSHHKLANYLAKFEQQVKTGRGINYSKGWPKIPDSPYNRLGRIDWTWISPQYPDADMFQEEADRGIWQEFLPGEYSLLGEPELCDCFQYALTGHRPRETIPNI